MPASAIRVRQQNGLNGPRRVGADPDSKSFSEHWMIPLPDLATVIARSSCDEANPSSSEHAERWIALLRFGSQ